MKKFIFSGLILGLVSVLSFGFFVSGAFAEEEANGDNTSPGASISLTPVSRTIQISSDSVYDGTMKVTNDGDEEIRVQVYASPYSYVYSEESDLYQLGFSNENNFTQISRWIKIKDASGEYVESPIFTIDAKKSLEISYQIKTPSNIPAGGQYAVIFAQTMTGNVSSAGIRTEASAGMILYGHSTEGEVSTTSEIRDMVVAHGLKDEATTTSTFYASAKVKNTGNVDFNAYGTLKVEPIIGFSSYETQQGRAIVSVIPESERIVSDNWEESPDFGLYKASWTVKAGENTETVEKVIFLMSPISIIVTIILLTIIIIGVIILVRKRKARRSRLAI